MSYDKAGSLLQIHSPSSVPSSAVRTPSSGASWRPSSQELAIDPRAAANRIQSLGSKEEKAEALAGQFESMLFGMMVKAMRANAPEGGMLGKGLGGSTYLEMFDQQLVQMIQSPMDKGFHNALVQQLMQKDVTQTPDFDKDSGKVLNIGSSASVSAKDAQIHSDVDRESFYPVSEEEMQSLPLPPPPAAVSISSGRTESSESSVRHTQGIGSRYRLITADEIETLGTFENDIL